MKKTLILSISLLLLLALLPLAQARAYGGTILAPLQMINTSGDSSGDMASLLKLDQSGTQDLPSNYVMFTTPGVPYEGTITYRLSAASLRASISQLRLKVNYKGPLASRQTWRWYAYNWKTLSWTSIGTNEPVYGNLWTTLVFGIPNPREHVDIASGSVRIMLRSSNADANARIDYQRVLVTFTQYRLGHSPEIPTTCPVFPPNNVWNTPIDSLPVHVLSSNWINSIGASDVFHMDFGRDTWDGGPIGIPYDLVDSSRVRKYYFQFYYADESDLGPYPLPYYVSREYGSDHHVLVVDTATCMLYEIYAAAYNANTGRWSGGSGAIWDLNSNTLRQAGWTSADAAGLPVLPGLVRYPEIATALQQAQQKDQVIPHALRFTVHDTYSYIWPARHLTSGSPGMLGNVPPMGARFRLKASFPITDFPPAVQVILRTMKKYGILLADNGSDWYVSGAPDQRWDNAMLHELDVLQGSDFEAVNTACMMVDADSAQASLSNCP